MSKEINYQTEKKQWTLYDVMQRTWRLLLIIGILGLISELYFMVVILIINGNQKQGVYAEIWFGLSVMSLLLSGLISFIIYANIKKLYKRIRDWVYVT